MYSVFIENKTFEKNNFTETPLEIGEYENCIFKNCDFSHTNVSQIKFIETQFLDCNISLAKLEQTTFREIRFINCKMLGLHFPSCNPFGIALHFENCNLNHSSFYQMKLKKTKFIHAQLHEVDFTQTDLSHSIFTQCNLLHAKFEHSILENVDFRTSTHFSINPQINQIKKAKFSHHTLSGLLESYDIDIE